MKLTHVGNLGVKLTHVGNLGVKLTHVSNFWQELSKTQSARVHRHESACTCMRFLDALSSGSALLLPPFRPLPCARLRSLFSPPPSAFLALLDVGADLV